MKSVYHHNLTIGFKEYLESESMLPTKENPVIKQGDFEISLSEDGKSVCIEAGVSDIWLIAKMYGRFLERQG